MLIGASAMSPVPNVAAWSDDGGRWIAVAVSYLHRQTV
jgi:hypothetical protein